NSTDKSFAFLFDMAEVFEEFMGRMYIDIDSSTDLKYSKSYGKLHLKPDILTSDKIIDIKYKIPTEKGKVSRDDKYQMFVYGTNIEGKRDTMLLYPKHTDDKKLLERKLELGEGADMVKLEMRSLDLEFDGGYSQYIDEVKKRLEIIK
ncbi:MAG: hypothetical protein KAI79_16100, partial [Bacteroidales bacterium]|nr:hypothetical protein [Bacteroidales bacterium]